MISKKFFINQASELTKKWIRHNVSIISFIETMEPTRLLKRQKCNFTCYGNHVCNVKQWVPGNYRPFSRDKILYQVIMVAIASSLNQGAKKTRYNNVDNGVMNTKQSRATGANAVGARRSAEAKSREAWCRLLIDWQNATLSLIFSACVNRVHKRTSDYSERKSKTRLITWMAYDFEICSLVFHYFRYGLTHPERPYREIFRRESTGMRTNKMLYKL